MARMSTLRMRWLVWKHVQLRTGYKTDSSNDVGRCVGTTSRGNFTCVVAMYEATPGVEDALIVATPAAKDFMTDSVSWRLELAANVGLEFRHLLSLSSVGAVHSGTCGSLSAHQHPVHCLHLKSGLCGVHAVRSLWCSFAAYTYISSLMGVFLWWVGGSLV